MKAHEVWPGGKCPKCGQRYQYIFKQEHGVGKRTCKRCGYSEEYEMPPIVEDCCDKSLSWPRYDPIQYVANKMRGKSDDDVDYGDYVEQW